MTLLALARGMLFDITIRTISESPVVAGDTREELSTSVRLRNCVSGTAPCS